VRDEKGHDHHSEKGDDGQPQSAGQVAEQYREIGVG
jgi:hypothetical protein